MKKINETIFYKAFNSLITSNVKILLLFGFVVLLRYKDQYTFQVMGGLAVTYLFLQTFAIPGSIFLSIVLGIQKKNKS